MTSASWENMATFNCFSVQGTGGSPTGPEPENRLVDQDMEAQVGQFLLGCKCLVSRGIFGQEQDPLSRLSAAFFPSKCPSITIHHNHVQLYWRGFLLEYQSGAWLPWLKFFVPASCDEIRNIISSRALPSTSYPILYSLNILPIDDTCILCYWKHLYVTQK